MTEEEEECPNTLTDESESFSEASSSVRSCDLAPDEESVPRPKLGQLLSPGDSGAAGGSIAGKGRRTRTNVAGEPRAARGVMRWTSFPAQLAQTQETM